MPRRRGRVQPETQIPEQFTLIPHERIVPVLGHVNPNNVRIPETTVPRGLRESIRALGLLQPIAVVETNRLGYFNIAAGRRRVQASRDEDLPMIPALIFPVGTPRHVAAAIAVSENNQRSANPLTDFRAIEAMIHAGSSERDIADQLAIPINTLRARMRLAQLIPEMRTALENGNVSVTLAERVARLTIPRQHLLAETLAARIAERGTNRARLTAADVRAVTEAQHQEQTDALPENIFHDDSPIRPIDFPTPAMNVAVTILAPHDSVPAVITLNQGERSVWYYANPIEFRGWAENGLRSLVGLDAIEHVEDVGARPRRRGRPPRVEPPPSVIFNIGDAAQSGWGGMATLVDAAIEAHPGDPDGGAEQILELLQGVRELIAARVTEEATNAG